MGPYTDRFGGAVLALEVTACAPVIRGAGRGPPHAGPAEDAF